MRPLMTSPEREVLETKISHMKEIFDLHVKCAEVALELARVTAEREVDRLKGWFFGVLAVVGALVAVANYFKS